jgi:hypothetical protein
VSASSGRWPVLATLTPEQVPALGPTSALRGLAAGIDAALRLAENHSPAGEAVFAATLRVVRSSDLFDAAYSREFAVGYTLIAAELRRIGGAR